MYFYWSESDSSEGHLTPEVSSASQLAVLESIHLASLQFICDYCSAVNFDIVLSKERQIALRATIADLVREIENVGKCALAQSSASTASVV